MVIMQITAYIYPTEDIFYEYITPWIFDNS